MYRSFFVQFDSIKPTSKIVDFHEMDIDSTIYLHPSQTMSYDFTISNDGSKLIDMFCDVMKKDS